MFIEIKRINRKGEEKLNLLDTERITSVIELSLEPTNYYDEFGNLAKTEEPTEKLFRVNYNDGTHYKINETIFNELKKVLVK